MVTDFRRHHNLIFMLDSKGTAPGRFLQGQSHHGLRRHDAGGALRPMVAPAGPVYGQAYPRQAGCHRAKHAGRRSQDRRQLCLFQNQTRWLEPDRLHRADALLRPTGRAAGDSIRLGEIRLDRGPRPGGIADVYARGEIHCRAFTIEAFLSREPYHTWRKKGFVRNIIQTGKKRYSKLPETPTIWELMDRYKTPESARRLATVMLGSGALGRPMIGSPGIPPDRVKILSDAFDATMKDPDFLADLDKRQFDLDPVPAVELEKIVKDALQQTPETIARMKKLLGE